MSEVQIAKAMTSDRAHSRVAEHLVTINRSRLRNEGLGDNNLLLFLYVHYLVYYDPV
jgi:hypothetical protein